MAVARVMVARKVTVLGGMRRRRGGLWPGGHSDRVAGLIGMQCAAGGQLLLQRWFLLGAAADVKVDARQVFGRFDVLAAVLWMGFWDLGKSQHNLDAPAKMIFHANLCN